MTDIPNLLNDNISFNSSEKINEKLPSIREFGSNDWFRTKTYRRDLPHWELEGSTYFITFCVDRIVGKPFQNPKLAQFAASTICHRKDKYNLYAYVVMPDHIHFILKPTPDNTLSKILQNMKGSMAYNLNKLLNRTGKFWQTENFDHLIRDGNGMRNKWEYIKENPVKAKLVNKAEDYPFSSFYEFHEGTNLE